MRTTPTPPRQAERIKFAELLQGYRTTLERHESLESKRRATLSGGFEEVLNGFRNGREKWRASQESYADGFNILDVLGVAREETRYSKLLAWLLDHRIEAAGTHAQGKLGFRLFLAELGLPCTYAEKDYWVRLEHSGESSRIDVEVAALGGFVIHIENKIHAAEGVDQTHREWADLRKRAMSLGIRGADAVHGVFITVDGPPPENDNFKALRWRRIARVFDRFAEDAKARDVKLFAGHCAQSVRELSVEALDEERSLEHDEE